MFVGPGRHKYLNWPRDSLSLHLSQWNIISITLVFCGWILLFTTPRAVVLSVCIGLRGCGWPISCRVILADTASHALMQRSPISASVADVTTALISCAMFNTAPLSG